MSAENMARSHTGVLQIAQTAIGGVILLVAGGVWNGLEKSNDRAQDQAKSIVRMEASLAAVTVQLGLMQTQLGAMTQISATLARIETRMDGAERRITEIEQTKRLK